MVNPLSDTQLSILIDSWNNPECSIRELKSKLEVAGDGTPISVRQIRSKARALLLPIRVAKNSANWTSEKVEILRTSWESGLTATHIGVLVNMSRNAVIGKKNRLKLPARRPTKAERAERAPMYKVRTRAMPKPNLSGGRVPPTKFVQRELNPLNAGVTIDALKWAGGHPANCRAIIREHVSGGPFYCGEAVTQGQSYCMPHCIQYLNQFRIPA